MAKGDIFPSGLIIGIVFDSWALGTSFSFSFLYKSQISYNSMLEDKLV